MSRAEITALVLSLRRRAEADAQEQLRRIGAQLELGRVGLLGAQRQLEQGQLELGRLTWQKQRAEPSAQAKAAAIATQAHELVRQSERLLRQRQRVRDLEHAVQTHTAQLQALLQRESELRAALRLALARREAAELHETRERREQRRNRAGRQQALEEEARDRFLSAQRQGKAQRPRRP